MPASILHRAQLLRTAAKLKPFGQRLIQSITESIFPSRCLLCGVLWALPRKRGSWQRSGTTPLAAGTPGVKAWCRLFLCPPCREAVVPLEPPLCSCCGLMFAARQGPDHLCGRCNARPPFFQQARAVGIYRAGLLKLIHRFKYNGQARLAGPLGLLLKTGFEHYWSQEMVDLILPVPLYRQRMRQRGFNQAYLMLQPWLDSKALAKADPSWQILRETLVRQRHTSAQTGLDRQARQANLRNAFRVANPQAVVGRHILLVDDVFTTGATADGCARVLRRAGARRVDVLTLARTL